MTDVGLTEKPITSKLSEQAAALLADRRAKAGQAYSEMLRRNDSPQAGDAERLADVMHTLGRDGNDLEDDTLLVQKIMEAEQAAGDLEAFEATEAPPIAQKYRDGMARFKAEREAFEKRWHEEIEALEREWSLCKHKRVNLNTVARQLDFLRRKWAERIGQPLPPVKRETIPAPKPSREEVIARMKRECERFTFSVAVSQRTRWTVADGVGRGWRIRTWDNRFTQSSRSSSCCSPGSRLSRACKTWTRSRRRSSTWKSAFTRCRSPSRTWFGRGAALRIAS
ncbi:MAG: hypothetical protein PVJ57_02680 [Phycisphaerae bacterium]|jgi:hypothetical protein